MFFIILTDENLGKRYKIVSPLAQLSSVCASVCKEYLQSHNPDTKGRSRISFDLLHVPQLTGCFLFVF